jgi:hypothetical protein
MKIAGWILLPALLLGATSAQARDIYCDSKSGSLPNGTERTHDWFVVNSTVRKPQLPGQTKPSTGCYISFVSFGGMYKPPEIIAKPKLGVATTTANRIIYRSAKNGEDLVSVRFHTLGRTGAIQSAIVHYRIHVVDKPL